MIKTCLRERYGFLKFTLAVTVVSFVLSPTFSLLNARYSTALAQSSAAQLFEQGDLEYRSKKFKLAFQLFQQAYRRYQREGNIYGESKTLNMISVIHIDTGNYQQALVSSEAALQLSRQVGDPSLIAETLGNLGISQHALGEYLLAIDSYKRALDILPKASNTFQKSRLLGLFGNVYLSLGDYTSALNRHQKSLEVSLQIDNPSAQVLSFSNIGTVYAHIGEFDKAVNNYLLSLQVAISIKDFESIAYLFNNLASSYDALGNEEKAFSLYHRSLEIARTLRITALEIEVLSNLGTIYAELNDYEQAILLQEQSLTKARLTHDPKTIATALNNLSHALFRAGNLTEAEQHLYDAIAYLESVRSNLHDTYNVSLFDTQIYIYNHLQQILAAQNKHEAALEISERGRAQAFVDLLAQRTTPERIENISNLARQPLTIEDIKTIAREQNATLVEYALVPDDDFKFQGRQKGPSSKIFIWVVKPTGEIIFKEVDLTELLPANTPLTELVFATRKVIDAQGEGRGTDTERSAENCHIDFDICLGDKVYRDDDEGDESQYEVAEINREEETVIIQRPGTYLPNPEFSIHLVRKVEDPEEWHSRLNQLHQILIEPIKNELPTNPEERVIFIPQEELFLVPFPALQDKSDDYLIEQHTISTVPSIQVLANTRQRRLFLANSTGDALIVGNPSPMPSLKTELSTAMRSDRSEGTQIPPLPHSATEANEIAQLLQTEALIASAATEAVVKQRLSNARLIHLATHGFFKENGDALQSSLALAARSENQDGFLTAEEILEYDLQADLVVLSACDTGRGQLTGDGVIGLSRSFIAAGTPSVIVSLWHVPDEATSELMLQFYQNHQTLDKAQSLRQAMLHMIEKEGSEPKDWAAFTLIGEAE